ncbi:MAG: Tll0287-like domain-containing protein [Flavobacteriaceae bacterium]
MKKLLTYRNIIWPIFIIVILGCKDVKTNRHSSGENEVDSSIHKEAEIKVDYSKMGMSYMTSTQAVLGKNLIGALEKKGPAGAVAFCNTQAIKLTDSMAQNHNVIIKRITDKPRNPNNKVNEEQLRYLRSYEGNQDPADSFDPIVVRKKKEVNFYYPIVTNAMCLQCHGIPNEQIQPETLEVLQDLYPDDLAQGYQMNAIRGLWYIQFIDEVKGPGL